MADKTSMKKFVTTGFYATSGAPEFKAEAEKISTDPAAQRAQAEAKYNPTYQAEQQSLNTQLTALIKSQTDDSELLNKQYQQSVNTMLEKIRQRGLATGSLPQTQTDALNKFKNEVMSERQAVYNTQKTGIENVRNTLANNYELNIQARMGAEKDNALQSLSSLLTQIAKLQSTSYEDYIKYLLAKGKKKSSGGGGGRYRRYSRGGGSSSHATTETPSSGLPEDYYSATKAPVEKPYVGGSNTDRVR